jgi:UV DNA damage endonuclease
MGSEIIPWIGHYRLEDLKDWDQIQTTLKQVGSFATLHGIRLTAHPPQYRVLCSPNSQVLHRTIQDLQHDSLIFDLMGFEPSYHNKLNIHIGGVYGNKTSALSRWVDNFHLLDENTKSRLTVENDDKTSAYTVEDLMFVHEKTNIPIVFDYHHHTCHSNGMTHKDALTLAMSTWQDGITPIVHVSEPRDDKNFRAHHDYIVNEIDTFGFDVDIMIEAKAKELALLEYRKNFELTLIK